MLVRPTSRVDSGRWLGLATVSRGFGGRQEGGIIVQSKAAGSRHQRGSFEPARSVDR